MKIKNLLEMTTPSSDTSNMGGSQAPKFGRDPHVLEDEKIEETTAGSVATGEPTNMGVQRRGKGSMFQGIKTSKKFVNSPVKEAIEPEQEKIDSLRRSRQERERGSERELGRDPKPSGQYYIMINGTTYKKDGEAVMFNSSIEAHRAVERIRAFRKSKGWSSARYDVIQQKGMEEALDPKALSALQQAKQSIAKNREADVAAWEQDFRKNFAAKYGSQMPPAVAQRPLNIPSTKPAPKPLEKHSVLKNRMVSLNAVIEKQKYLDFLAFKAEQKGLLNPRLEADIDTSLYVKGSEKDDYQALNQKLDKSIDLMKTRLGINKLAYKKPKPMREEGVTEAGPRMVDQFGNEVQRTSGQTVQRDTKPRELRTGDARSTATGIVTKTDAGIRHKPYSDVTPKPRFVEQGVEEGNDPYEPEAYDEFASDTYSDDNLEDEKGVAEAVTLDRSKNPSYPNDPATVNHRLDTAKAILSNPNSDSDSRRAAAAIIAKSEKGVAEAADVMEADLSEEHIMAKDLFKRFDLFKQGKDRALGNKPADKEIMTKEGQLTAERLPKEYIEKAIYRVLMKAYPEVIRQYGSPIVSDAISSVAEMHKDIENIEAEEASIMLHQVINQLKNLQMREEKQRLDPSCWDNKKIGNPKTKVKGGVRVNNCVPK
jgi:hypothetical protein